MVLLVPLLLAGVLGALRVTATSQTANDLRAFVDRVGLGQQLSGLVHELQNERSRAAAFVAADRRDYRPQLEEQMARVDAALPVLTGTAPEDFGPAAADIARAAQVRIAGLASLRQATVQTRFPTAAVITTYTSLIDSLMALSRAVFTTPDSQLLRQADDIVLMGDAKEQVQRQHAALLPALASDLPTATDQTLARSASAQFDAVLAEFTGSGLPAARDLYAQVVSGTDVDNRERIELSTLTAFANGNPPTAAAEDWVASAQRTADLVREVETRLQAQLRTDGDALAAAAGRDAARDVLIVLIAVALTLALLVVVARSMIRPLRALRSAAFDVAQRRLPQAIERIQGSDAPQQPASVESIGIDTEEEIGEVARAFDAVHAEAVRLAAEQALLRANINDIFVNLSRRSQGLVKRQLSLIDKLESDEQDPEHLGNLFQLDHLATRMRRNNENLLVLAGAAELRPRRRRPVLVDDVLRAAVSEVEDYQRVMVRRAPSVSVAGAAVNDLVHLIAELLDNATSFSRPESTVVLSSALDHGGALVVEIADSGVGMDGATLQMINSELADPPTVDVAVSRRMGLFVVARLARRNDIDVRLQPAATGPGLVAVVTVPSVLLMAAGEAAALESGTSQFAASGSAAVRTGTSSSPGFATASSGGSGPSSGDRTGSAPVNSSPFAGSQFGTAQFGTAQFGSTQFGEQPGTGQFGGARSGAPHSEPGEAQFRSGPSGSGGPGSAPSGAGRPGAAEPSGSNWSSTEPAPPRADTPVRSSWDGPAARPSLPRRAGGPAVPAQRHDSDPRPSAWIEPSAGVPAPRPIAPRPIESPQQRPPGPVSGDGRPSARPAAELTDLFGPSPSTPHDAEPDVPIYDEVKTSWFRLQMGLARRPQDHPGDRPAPSGGGTSSSTGENGHDSGNGTQPEPP
ncbi:MAG TPA: nitrate- and nitrite sensing domain-containing protein, partial [Pseudonocardia sp.]|nr:nitrate- and nitrite sensing domain-containing protein [Pseudonocardia sp.]